MGRRVQNAALAFQLIQIFREAIFHVAPVWKSKKIKRNNGAD